MANTNGAFGLRPVGVQSVLAQTPLVQPNIVLRLETLTRSIKVLLLSRFQLALLTLLARLQGAL
jgi:hypothetical protein